MSSSSSSSDGAQQNGPEVFARAAARLDGAVNGFPAALGKKVRERRAAAPMSPEDLVAMLGALNVSTTAADLKRLEAGKATLAELDLRLLTGLIYLLEISLDELLVGGFLRAIAAANAPAPRRRRILLRRRPLGGDPGGGL